MIKLDIQQIPVLADNYVYLVHDPETGKCAAIDPAVATPVLEALDRLGWSLSHVLCTHHHGDHIGGNLDLKRMTGCTIVAAARDRDRIPGVDTEVHGGDSVAIGNAKAKVFEVPGHTKGHVAYWFAESDALFCGDTLFSLGCGRLFEGTPAQMWASLETLRGLPDETRVFCAHEYTNSNADFALSIDPDNADLQARAEDVLALRQAGKPTVPSTMGLERATNPFLRVDCDDLLQAAELEGMGPVLAFAEIRNRKDNF